MLAKPNEKKFIVSNHSGLGHVIVTGEEVTVSLGKSVTIKKNYVFSIEKTATLALNKVEVNLAYYDLFGNKEDSRFIMAENDFRALKALIGK